MDNDLIFGTETSDMLTGGTPGDEVQLAAATAANLPPFDDALTRPFDAAQVVVPEGADVVRIAVTPGEIVELPFPSDAQFLARIDNGNLAIKVGDVTVILQGYVEAAGQTAPVVEASNGQPLDIATILASTDPNIDIQTAAGPAAGPQGQGADNSGGILTQFGEGAGLGGFEGAGAQDGTDGLGGGTVDQTGTLFKLFGLLAINEVPVANDDAYTTNEDVKLTVAAGTGLLANDSDPDGDPLTVLSVTQPANGTVVANADGSFTYTPNKDYNGLDTFTYTSDDGKGGNATATVTITVNPVNDAPVWQSGFVGQTFAEDTANHSAPLKWVITDVDDSAYTIAVVPGTLPPDMFYNAATKTLTFNTQGNHAALKDDQSEVYTITFTITDAHGGQTTKDVVVTITSDAPVGNDDNVFTNVGTDAAFIMPEWALVANDTDSDSKNLDVVSTLLTPVINFTTLTHADGTGSNGTITYKEDAVLDGSFKYETTDGAAVSDDPAQVTVHNQIGGDITGAGTNDILIGSAGAEKLDGAAGNDVIIGNGGGDEIFGGAGDDTLVFSAGSKIHGETDGGAIATHRGDVLAISDAKVDFSDHASVANIDGIETISMQERTGGSGAQSLVLGAHSIQDLSDHTLTPGGLFTSAKDAVRIDGDAVDQLYLSISADGGKWVNTTQVVDGYHVYAHEMTDGVPATTDAYVMVQTGVTVHTNTDV